QVQTLFSKSVIVIQPVGHDRQHVIDDKGDQCGNGTYERGRKDEAEVELCLCACSENCEITHHDHRRHDHCLDDRHNDREYNSNAKGTPKKSTSELPRTAHSGERTNFFNDHGGYHQTPAGHEIQHGDHRDHKQRQDHEEQANHCTAVGWFEVVKEEIDEEPDKQHSHQDSDHEAREDHQR